MSQCHPTRLRASGFTIIELMIALVVVGVLLSLAFPSLMDSIRKSRRAEAFTKVSAVQIAQERFRSNNSTYATSLTNGPASSPAGLGLPSTTADGRYQIALDGATADTYRVTAIPISGTSQVDDGNCAKLRLRVDRGNTFYESGTAAGSPSESMGRQCWVR